MHHFLALIFPFGIYTVSGRSMYPHFSHGEKVLVQKRWFFATFPMGSVIVLQDPRNKKIILKRIKKITGNTFFVVGDNGAESTDSRVFGPVVKVNIIGRVIFPKA